MSAATLLVPEATMERWLERQGWSLGRLADGDYPVSLDDAQRYLLQLDPALWMERNLLERDAGGRRLWRLFDYQRQAARYRGSAVYKCAAEVGKTREVVGLHLWKATVYQRRGLIAAARDGHLESIWDELLFQAKSVPHLRAAVDWDATRVKPYRKLAFRGGAVLELRPAGTAGEAFRGLHVHDLSFDEAALVDAERAWIEFWRAGLPEVEMRVYSTPNGRRDTRFYRLTRQAVPAASYAQAHPQAFDPLALPPLGTDEHARALKGRPSWLLFQWRKPQMPERFWNPDRQAKAIELYGGLDAPGYLQNVMGEDGDATDAVFPHQRFAPCLRYLAEYRHLDLRIDRPAGELRMTVQALEEGYRSWALAAGDAEPAESAGAAGEGGESPPSDVRTLLRDEPHRLADVDWRGLLAPWIDRLEGRLVGGIDPGWTRDPTEIVVDRLGKAHRWVLRLTLYGFESPEQRGLVEALDDLLEPELGWGLDATGAGTPLEQELRSGAPRHHRFGERLSGWIWNVKTDDRHPGSGDVLFDSQTGAPRRANYKELATRLLEHQLRAGALEYPLELSILTEWTNHTARPTSRGERIFDHRNDHSLDAQRAAELRAFLLEHGSSEAPVEFLPVPGARRELLAQLRRF